MFNLFNDNNNLKIRRNDAAVNESINQLKEKATNRLFEYDEIILSPDKTAEQRRFLVNTRESFVSVLDAGYSLLILFELTQLLPGSTYDKIFNIEAKTVFENSIEDTYHSISCFEQCIKDLVNKQIIRKSDKKGTPLSTNSSEFLDDGFDYIITDYSFNGVFEIFNYHSQRLITEIIKGFSFSNLTLEQAAYYEQERLHLLICIKEACRASAYDFLLNNTLSGSHTMAVSMLEQQSITRFKYVLSIIDCLANSGIISI